MKITRELLSKIGTKGKYLAVMLTMDHSQPKCRTVPMGTVGVIKQKCDDGTNVFVFPHDVLNEQIKAFSDGDVRIVPDSSFKPVGRVG